MPQRPGRELTIEERRELDRLDQNDRRRKAAGASCTQRDVLLARLNDDGVSTRTLGAYLDRSSGTISQAVKKGRKARESVYRNAG